MARNPASTDAVGVTIRHAEQIRLERLKSRGHCEIKNYVIAFPITSGMIIPRIFIGINPDDATPEWKMLFGFAAVLEVGSCTLSYLHNGTPLIEQTVTTTEGHIELDAPLELAHLDTIKPAVQDASDDANYLTVAPIMVTSAR